MTLSLIFLFLIITPRLVFTKVYYPLCANMPDEEMCQNMLTVEFCRVREHCTENYWTMRPEDNIAYGIVKHMAPGEKTEGGSVVEGRIIYAPSHD